MSSPYLSNPTTGGAFNTTEAQDITHKIAFIGITKLLKEKNELIPQRYL